MRKFVVGAASLLAGAMMASTTAKADCGEVTVGAMDWASAQVITAVTKFLMEQGYGCKVSVVKTSTQPVVTSVAETGKPDVVTELWINSAPKYPALEKEGKVVTLNNVFADGGVEAWWIPTYLAEKHPELKTIDGVLKNPELVGGRFHNCPEGWGCRVINDNLKVAFELEKNGVEVFDHGSGETLATSLASAYTDKKPWFGYYWAPTAILGKYDMTKVDVGPHKADVHDCNTKKDCANPGKSAYPSSRVVSFATTDFAKRQPEVAEMMKKMAFTNKELGDVLAWREDNKASGEESAVYYLQKYKDSWSSWINEDAKTKLSALLK